MQSSSSSRFSFDSFRSAVAFIAILLPAVAVQSQDQAIVAVVNGQPITAAFVDSDITPQLYPLQQQIHALRKVALENLISRLLLEGEARRKGLSLDEIKKQITIGEIEVTNDQVDALYLENAAAFASMSADEARHRLRLDLESQARMRNYRAAIAELRQKSTIEIFLAEPRLRTSAVNVESTQGPKTAPVVITEFSDFQCPYCRAAQTAIRQVLNLYPEQVRLEFRHLPLEIHADAFAAAVGAVCAGEQRSFWRMHEALFVLDSLSLENLKTTAKSLGLEVNQFNSCLSSERAKHAVRTDLLEARRLGINGTPTFLINGTILRGAVTLETLKANIDRELRLASARSRLTPSPSLPEDK